MSAVHGKTVLITGASRGIGAAAALEFAAAGANVVLAARTTVAAEDIAGKIRDTGGAAVSVKCDVTSPAQVEISVQTAIDTFGGVDILVANAGLIDPIGRIEDISSDAWGDVIDVNVKGVFYGIRASLPGMIKQGGGTVITIGSGAASSALEGWSHYCASKAAVHHLNTCLDKEYREQGIRALVLSPGTVATGMQQQIKDSKINPVAAMDWSVHIPPDWPARALVWMCSPEADDWCGKVVSLRDDAIKHRIGLIE